MDAIAWQCQLRLMSKRMGSFAQKLAGLRGRSWAVIGRLKIMSQENFKQVDRFGARSGLLACVGLFS